MMKQAYDSYQAGAVSEMAIVDAFTKLIFGQEDEFSPGESMIIQGLRRVDPNVAMDSHQDMGQYLRALGVQEMVKLVARVQAHMSDGITVLTAVDGPSILDRRSH